MVSEITINNIKQTADILSIIGNYIDIKKHGSSYKACCPFHNEKTPSFNINTKMNIFKCFGCGKTGDAIEFVMSIDRLSFVEAVEKIAAQYSIEVILDKDYTPEEKEAIKEKKANTEQLFDFVEKIYIDNLHAAPDDAEVWQWLRNRGISRAMATVWRMGYGGNTAQGIANKLINKGWYNIALEYGLLRTVKGVSYDVYKNRITLPSYSRTGLLNGFIGRTIKDEEPKYINPPESDIYSKGKLLFGLKEATEAIRTEGFAYLVEGNLDVKMLQAYGYENTVAPGGTALTPDQVELLSRHCNHVILIPDNDEAGIKAADKNIDLFLGRNFRVEVVELPYGEDPDSFVRNRGEVTTG